MMARVSLPGSFTAMPSAMVEAANCGVVPFIAWYIAGKRTISTPNTSIAGCIAFAAIEMPEMSPPPPMATMSASSSGCVRSISSPHVPCPAMIFSSS